MQTAMTSRFSQSFLLELVEKLLQTESQQAALNVIASHLRFSINLESMTLLLDDSTDYYRLFAQVVSRRVPQEINSDVVAKATLDIEGLFNASESISSAKLIEDKAFGRHQHYFTHASNWKVFRVSSGQRHFGYAFISSCNAFNTSEMQLLRSVFEHLAFALFRMEQQTNLKRVNNEVSRNNALLIEQQDSLKKANEALLETLEEIHNAQEELLEVRKQASLGKVVRGIAHEINTPAGVCVTASSSIDNICKKILQDLEQNTLTQKEFVLQIENIRKVGDLLLLNSEKVTDLVKTFKHAAIDEWQEPAIEFNLHTLLHEARSQSTFRSQTTANIEIKCPKDIYMFGFSAALRESIVLLIDNAIHFALLTPADKAIVTAKKEQDSIVINITDTGKGMTKNQSEKLFEPFFTSKQNQSHIGLGAHIVHNLITQKYRGSIKLLSAPLQPTNIEIKVPQAIQ